MLQNVNLYLPEFRKKRDWFTATVMLQVVGVTAAVLALASAHEYWQQLGLRAELAEKEAARAQAIGATETLIARYGVQSEDLSLLEDIEKLEAAVQEKRSLLSFLEGRDQGNAEGFSEHLADLARFHVKGLSLTGISLQAGGQSAHLSGQVLRAELVPLYLQNLSKGSAFAGKQFETLQIRDIPADEASGAPALWVFEVGSQETAGGAD